jgi:hypothetical protein
VTTVDGLEGLLEGLEGLLEGLKGLGLAGLLEGLPFLAAFVNRINASVPNTTNTSTRRRAAVFIR